MIVMDSLHFYDVSDLQSSYGIVYRDWGFLKIPSE